MLYKKYTPTYFLKDYVECYYIWRNPVSDSPSWIDTPPNAFTAFVFNLENSYAVRLEEDRIIELPRSFISGQSIKNYALKVDKKIDQIGIVFKPTGIFHLFGLPLYEFTNTRINLHDVLQHDVKHIEEQLYNARTDESKIQILEKLLLAKLHLKEPELDGVDFVSHQIIDSYGNLNFSQLLSGIYMSRRKFERHFFRRVGLSPKYYARIRRFGATCALFAGQRTVAWDQVLHKTGYYDQSHFIKDFKEFSGLSPSEYLQSNNELAHKIKSS